MLPYYVAKSQTCNYCDSDLHHGYIVLIHDNTIYCDKDCFLQEVYENAHIKVAYLTSDKMMREVD